MCIRDSNKKDILDNSAGIEFNVKVGDPVKKGELVMRCFNSNEKKILSAYSQLTNTFEISENKIEPIITIFES